jgi:hypothetical protein
MSRFTDKHLDPYRVAIALKVQQAKHELAMKMVAERVKIDAEFAKDVLKIGGDNLREDIKLAAQATIEVSKSPAIIVVDESKLEKIDPKIFGDTDKPIALSKIILGESHKCDCENHFNDGIPYQSDGGGIVLIHETELPDYPKDGE